MAGTAVEICKLALVKMGASDVLASIDAPTTPNERIMAIGYPHYRDVVLRQHRWLFAIKVAELSRIAATFVGADKPYRFTLPTDFIRYIREPGQDYELRGREIVSADTVATIRYVSRPPDASIFDPSFKDVLATRIAFELVEKIKQSTAKKDDLRTDLRNALDAAMQANAFERGPEDLAGDDNNFTWISGRFIND